MPVVHTSHILLVDDEVRFADNLAKLLKKRGFAVSTAYDGRQALDALHGNKDIEVVVLDVRMPGMDGIETLQHIKRDFADKQVIMLTGQASVDDGIEAVRAGAFDYLLKLYDIEDLVTKIRAACNVEQIKRHPVLWPRTKAGEIILSGFVPLYPEEPLSRAVAIFNRYRDGEGGHMLFIVDRQQHVQGSVTRRDLLNALGSSENLASATWEQVRPHPDMLPDIPLERIMNRTVDTVAPETPLPETAQRMLRNHYDSMPVVDEGCVQGVIRLRDVFRYMQSDGDSLIR